MGNINIQATINEKCETTQAKVNLQNGNGESITTALTSVSNHSTYNTDIIMFEIWKQLHRRYTNEIENLWQRSIFLATFIVLTCTGYGCYFKTIFLCSCYRESMLCHLPCLFLGIILCVLGFLWIAMIKGSKFWCEIYEKKISLLEDVFFPSNMNQFKLRQLKQLQYGNEQEEIADLVDGSFRKLDASRRSPSKINILLGWLIHFCGGLIMLMHTGIMSYIYFRTLKYCILYVLFFFLIAFIVIIVLDMLFWHFSKGGVRIIR